MKKALKAVLIWIPALIYVTFTFGVLTQSFYEWFVQPVFHDAPSISFAQAIGLSFVVSLFKTGYDTNAPKRGYDSEIDKILAYIVGAALPWFTLLLGYIFKIFFL